MVFIETSVFVKEIEENSSKTFKVMNEENFQQLKESIEEVGDIMKGSQEPARVTRIKEPDVKQIRNRLGLTQSEFASIMGISTGTLRNWEQGRRTPQGAARVLLWITSEYPEIVLETVRKQVEEPQ